MSSHNCHAREDGHPSLRPAWIPAYAGMTEWKGTYLTLYLTVISVVTINSYDADPVVEMVADQQEIGAPQAETMWLIQSALPGIAVVPTIPGIVAAGNCL